MPASGGHSSLMLTEKWRDCHFSEGAPQMPTGKSPLIGTAKYAPATLAGGDTSPYRPGQRDL